MFKRKKEKVRFSSVFIIVMIIFGLTQSAHAVCRNDIPKATNLPSFYYGTAMIQGLDVQAGDKIRAYVDDVIVNGGCVGFYEVDNIGEYGAMPIYGDDVTTSEKDGVMHGDIIRFFVCHNGFEYELNETSVWSSSYVQNVVELNLTADCTNYYRDHDSDSYGDTNDVKCFDAPEGEYTAIQGGDCNDNDASINPEAVKAICQDITIPLNTRGRAPRITPSQIDNGSNDSCGIASMSVSPNIFTCAEIGDNSVVLTVMNYPSGNTSKCTATVTVVDNIAPVPRIDPLPEVRGIGNVTLTPPRAYDNCAGVIDATTSDPTTYTVLGAYTVTWTYDDNNGNTTQQIQDVIVADIDINLSPGESIQGAIIAAGFGAEIILAQGTYNGTINFNGNAITIRSEDPDDPNVVAATIINAGESGTAVTFNSGEGSRSVLSGITIENGKGENGGGIYCNGASPVITKCIIRNNTANKGGGGIFCDTNSSPVIQRCYITNNDGCLGGGISGFRAGSSMKITNCLIADNEAHKGAGIFFEQDCSPEITNCTITNNKANKDASGVGGGICLYAASSPVITNCILWGNTASEGNEIYFENSVPSIYYSDIKGGWTGTGANNIDADPLFADSNAGNYHLQFSYSCIEAGTDVDIGDKDIEGKTRLQAEGYDMGAYEYIKGDINDDGEINAYDVVLCIQCVVGLIKDPEMLKKSDVYWANNDYPNNDPNNLDALDVLATIHIALCDKVPCDI